MKPTWTADLDKLYLREGNNKIAEFGYGPDLAKPKLILAAAAPEMATRLENNAAVIEMLVELCAELPSRKFTFQQAKDANAEAVATRALLTRIKKETT